IYKQGSDSLGVTSCFFLLLSSCVPADSGLFPPSLSLYQKSLQNIPQFLFLLLRSLIQHLHLVSSMFSSQGAGHTDTGVIFSAVILQDLLMDGAFLLSMDKVGSVKMCSGEFLWTLRCLSHRETSQCRQDLTAGTGESTQ
ncbi:unnamed protein product, partial [Staurois parvus]